MRQEGYDKTFFQLYYSKCRIQCFWKLSCIRDWKSPKVSGRCWSALPILCKIKTLEGFHQLKIHSHWYLLSQHQFIMQLTTPMPWRFLFTCVPVVVAGGPWQLGTKGEHQVEQSPGKKNDVGHTGVQEDHLPTIADTCRVRYGTFSFRQTSLNLLYLCLIHDLSCLLFP